MECSALPCPVLVEFSLGHAPRSAARRLITGACFPMAKVAVFALWGGYRAYALKEVGRPAAPVNIPPRTWWWTSQLAAGLLLALFLAASLARDYPRFFDGAL